MGQTSSDAVARAALIRKWQQDPVAWIGAYWPGTRIYSAQEEVLLSVRDNDETHIPAANEMGKTRVAAWVVLWWFCTRFPAKVLTSASTESQLRNVLWGEIDKLLRTAETKPPLPPLGIIQKVTELRVMDHKRGREYGDHYVVAKVAREVEGFAGAHEPMVGGIPRVLVVFDEASGIGTEFYDAAQPQAHRLLCIGNPLQTDNFFYRVCKKGDVPDPLTPGRLNIHVRRIDGVESPNVIAGNKWKAAGESGPPPVFIPGILSWEQFQRRDREWDPIKKKIRLHGKFHEGSEFLLFPPTWLDAAEELWELLHDMPLGPCSLGVDVAEGGRDLSSWPVIDPLGLRHLETMSTPDTAVIPTKTIGLMERYNIPAHRVMFDRGGGGKQHVDTLWQMGYRVRMANFGGAARDSKTYKNLRAELYGLLREAMRPEKWGKVPVADADGNPTGQERWTRCFMLPPENTEQCQGVHELRGELAVLPLMYDSELKMVMLPKQRRTGQQQKTKTLDELIGRSPDRADALALANYAAAVPMRAPPPRYEGELGEPEEVDEERREEVGSWASKLEEQLFGGTLQPEEEKW